LGDGGYDALHYFLNLRYATRSPAQGIDGTVTMTAKATQALSRFDLDFSGSGVGAVQVDGRKAHMVWTGGKLVITPAAPIAQGQCFTVVVHNFTAKPTTPVAGEEGTTAFFITPDGSATAGQPNLMNSVYPSNDYPSEKATFSFRMDVPAGETAVANGDLTGERTAAGRSVWTYSENQPMATELTQLVAGKFTVIPLSVETSQMAWMEKRVGAYPFDQFGSLITDPVAVSAPRCCTNCPTSGSATALRPRPDEGLVLAGGHSKDRTRPQAPTTLGRPRSHGSAESSSRQPAGGSGAANSIKIERYPHDRTGKHLPRGTGGPGSAAPDLGIAA
jgi:hypothetical protein